MIVGRRVQRLTRRIICILLAIASLPLIISGVFVASLQFTRDNPDSPYFLVGIAFILMGAPFARAAVLVVRSTQRVRDWACIAVYTSLLFLINLSLGAILSGTPGILLTAAIGILAAGALLITMVLLYAKRRPDTRD